MCGIAGVYGELENERILNQMLGKLRHRGPDDHGAFLSQEASFIHARLSIVDVAGGKQPICSEDGTICLVFNGEIYNHKELRKRLDQPHQFGTKSDGEVIIHLYEEMGDKCVELLDGMFAFALYDGRRGLLMARDPLGIKPLYISRVGDAVYFASEMKALLGIVQDFEVFPSGHLFQCESGLRKFFSVPHDFIPDMSFVEARDGIRKHLERAVEKRLMADVPLGVFLSGGLDSSIIAAIAARKKPGLNTFSVGMATSPDREFALMASEYLGTRHHEEVYTLDDMLNVLPEVIYHLESYDAALVRSAVPNYFLARLASRQVKVVLSGEGADELFSGYHYLKDVAGDELHNELVEITEALHNTNLQRCDRLTMAHGIEGRVPFLDIDLLRFAFSIPVSLKLGTGDVEKWILRKAFEDHLPDEIIWRRKSKFSEGAGSCDVLAQVAEEEIPDAQFEKERELPDGRIIPNKEEMMYYRIFRKFYPADCAGRAVGFSRSL